jgi:hypothetical protein
MRRLVTAPNIDDPDGFFAELLAVHDELDPESSAALNARLILLLANHIGDRSILSAALQEAARAGAVPD